jgi:hypothetical protein
MRSPTSPSSTSSIESSMSRWICCSGLRGGARQPGATARWGWHTSRCGLRPCVGRSVAGSPDPQSGSCEAPLHRGHGYRAALHGPRDAVHVHGSDQASERGRRGSPGTHGPCHRANAAALLARRQRRKASCSRGGVAPRPARFEPRRTEVSGDFGGDHRPGACRSAQRPPRHPAQAASTTGAGHGGRTRDFQLGKLTLYH